MAVSNKMGSSPPTYERGLVTITDNNTTLLLDANFVNATSGKCYAIRFSAPVSQSSAAFTCYAFLTTKAASPTDIRAAVFAGPSGAMDAQRPDTGAALGTSAAVDVSAQTNLTWTTFSISSLSLTAGATYWLCIYNNTGTPGTNTATYKTRALGANIALGRFPAYTTTDGFTTDPSAVSLLADAVIVMKFSDGSLLGNPYSVSTAHASNANDRGNRYRFDTSTTVAGLLSALGQDADLTGYKVYQGSTEVASVTADRSQINNNLQFVFFDAPVTFSAATDYDVVAKYGGAATIGNLVNAGTSPPADVTSCMPAGLSNVDGATPGSYTEVDGATGIFLLIDNVPASSGSSYTGMMLV